MRAPLLLTILPLLLAGCNASRPMSGGESARNAFPRGDGPPRMEIDLATHEVVVRRAATAADVPWPAAPAKFLEWLRRLDLPEDVVSAVAIGWPEETADFIFWRITNPLETVRTNVNAPHAVRDGFLEIGAGLSGDPIVIRISGERAGEVGFLAHERYWESEPGSLPTESSFTPLSPNLTAFLLGVLKNALPIDSYGTWTRCNTLDRWTYTQPSDGCPE